MVKERRIHLPAEDVGKHEPMIDCQHETRRPLAIPILLSLHLNSIFQNNICKKIMAF